MKVPAAVVSAVILALAAALPVAAYTILESGDQTGNGVADIWALDDNGDRRMDRMLIDGNEDGSSEVAMYIDISGRMISATVDTNFDTYTDLGVVPFYAAGATRYYARMLMFDNNQDSRWENAYYDGNLDGYYESVCVDSNYDGQADLWLANSAPAGRSATDDMARRVAASNWVNIMHGLGLPAFFQYTTYPMGG